MSRTVSIFTFYNPTAKNVENMLIVAEQSDITVICDNSYNSNADLLKGYFNNFDSNKIIYRPFYENLGLSSAFNRILKDESFNWQDDDFVFFFDQDSSIDTCHISKLKEEFCDLETKTKLHIGCLGPVYYDVNKKMICRPRLYHRINDTCIEVNSIITSSMCVRYKTLRLVNFWNEQIFLDMADWDICWRVRAQGLSCVMTDKVYFRHSVGDGQKNIGLMNINLMKLDIAKPFREYYQTRDCLNLLCKKYVPLKNKIRFILQVTLRPLLHLLFLENRKERFYYIRLGIQHYRQGITGVLKNYYAS